jgi:hypothetical protein
MQRQHTYIYGSANPQQIRTVRSVGEIRAVLKAIPEREGRLVPYSLHFVLYPSLNVPFRSANRLTGEFVVRSQSYGSGSDFSAEGGTDEPASAAGRKALPCWKQLSQRSLIRRGDYSAERREACTNQAFAANLSCIPRMTIVKRQLPISPALARQSPQQVYRVSGSSPPFDRYFSRSPWVHFQ